MFIGLVAFSAKAACGRGVNVSQRANHASKLPKAAMLCTPDDSTVPSKKFLVNAQPLLSFPLGVNQEGHPTVNTISK